MGGVSSQPTPISLGPGSLTTDYASLLGGGRRRSSGKSLRKTKGSLLIARINSRQVSAHFIGHLPSHPSTSIGRIIQSGPFRGPGAIVSPEPGSSKRPELVLSCPGTKLRGLKGDGKKKGGLVKRGPQLASERLLASSLCQAWGAGHLVGVQQRFVELILFLFILKCVSRARALTAPTGASPVAWAGHANNPECSGPRNCHSDLQSTFLGLTLINWSPKAPCAIDKDGWGFFLFLFFFYLILI